MDILISTLEVIITEYAEATEGSVVNGGVDDVISLPTVLYLSSTRCSLYVAFTLCFVEHSFPDGEIRRFQNDIFRTVISAIIFWIILNCFSFNFLSSSCRICAGFISSENHHRIFL